jgi:hypothetical protein
MQPHFDPCNVNGANYLALLKDFFLPKWNAMPFHEESFFQQDGAPPHYANVVKDYLNEKLGPRWIGRGVTEENAISWPARNPDLTPCDFFLWGIIKDKVYTKQATNLMQLQQNICEAFDELKEREDYMVHVMLSLPERYQKCIELGGGQVV